MEIPREMININSTVVGNWRKNKVLGRGSFGEVSLWTRNQESVAIKICCCETLQSQEAYSTFDSRWHKEIEILKNHSYKYLVKWINIPEFMVNKNLKIIVMEYCELGDLRFQLCKIENCNGFKELEVRNVLKCLGKAVKFLHDNEICHRDIKPENIVITKPDDINIYKLTDFGYAKKLVNTAAASMVGTEVYLAPEIVISPEYSCSVDYWSLGIVIFEVICGERPFCLDIYREFIEQIKNKHPDEIAISKDVNSEIKKSKNLNIENHLSPNFKELMENWLRLALKFDPKIRGKESIRSEMKLTFFTRIEEALKFKFLTIFSLWNYEFYSIPIDDQTTKNDLYEILSKKTGLASIDIEIIMPIEQCCSVQKDKIINLYCLDLHPMLYVAKMNESKKIKDLVLSELVLQIINSHDVNISVTFLRKFARKVLYMVQNEQKHYVTYLKGLQAYALEINDRLCKLKPYNMNMEVANLSSSINVFQFLLIKSKILVQNNQVLEQNCIDFIQKWENKLKAMKDGSSELIKQISLFQREYDLNYNKSKETVESEYLKDISQDYFDTKAIENAVINMTKFGSGENKDVIQKCVYSCIEKRKKLLSSGLEALHNNINESNVIYVALNKRLKVLNDSLQSQNEDIRKLLELYQEELFFLKDNNTTSITRNITNLSLASFCFDTTDDINKLIEANENVTLEVSRLITETDSMLSLEHLRPKTLP